MASWGFLKDGAGILPASNMADPLRATHLRETDVLVREAVQNSLDERRADADAPVRIRFERTVLTGGDKQRFVDGLCLRELSDRRTAFRAAHGWFAAGNPVLDALHDPGAPLPLLTISDFGANGLGGRWNRRGSRDDRFFNLVLSIGGSLKWEEEDQSAATPRSLGSYGYGKMAFAMCSDIRTVVYYSTFRPDQGSVGTTCRAMASSFLPQHSIDGVNYAGQAYFGCESDESSIPKAPFVDDDAHDWMRNLGLPQRTDLDTGTTIVIPATTTSMTDLVRCCETWWWPRMREPDPLRRVQFEFIDDGSAITSCNPRSRPELSPFIDCYRVLPSLRQGDGYQVYKVEVRPEGAMRAAGRLVLKALPASPAGAPEPDEDQAPFRNAVALVRDGLVVKYEASFAHEDKTPVVGVFAPDTDVQTLQAFVFSEPPSHDEWQENSDRLRGRFAWGRDFLRLTKKRLRSLTRDFQVRQAPPPHTEKTLVDAFLRRALSDLFRPPKRKNSNGANKPPKPNPRAYTIATRESGRRQTDTQTGLHEDFAVFRIQLSDHAPVESANVDVTVSLRALSDVDARPTDAFPCEVIGSDGTRAHFQQGSSAKNTSTLTLTLHRDDYVDVSARGLVHPQWKTQWEISVDRRGDTD